MARMTFEAMPNLTWRVTLEGKAKYFPIGRKLHHYRNPKILAFSVIFVFIRGDAFNRNGRKTMNQNKTKELKSSRAEPAGDPTKAELERQMEQTRESLSQTVQEIKETVSDQVTSVKETVGGVLDYREQFKEEPMVWSLGALSAGFALGYTLGYAHKNIKGSRKKSEVAAFANTLATELSTVGNTMVMPALSAKIKDLFGFDFADLLDDMGGKKRVSRKKALPKRAGKSAVKKRSKSRK